MRKVSDNLFFAEFSCIKCHFVSFLFGKIWIYAVF